MIEAVAFRTQARTVDHLGREQIADCPTAVSELWKNAYDAYARSVELHIFDSSEPVAAIYDDGHGMNYDEFLDRWLVVGTESKYDPRRNVEADRDGLPERTKQGQKGIGRLSSANLGPLLLLVSKRKDQDFVAALIDWRIFENPFLVLNDIEVPVTSFVAKEDLVDLLPALFDRLVENVWGGSDDRRRLRLEQAWAAYDDLVISEDKDAVAPSKTIAETIINTRFSTEHFRQWQVWSGTSDHGTAMFMSNINFDLKAQLPSVPSDGAIPGIRNQFFRTLSAFVDPLADSSGHEVNAVAPDFTYAVKVWDETGVRSIVNGNEIYSRADTDVMEHVIEGTVDDDGFFRGQIKAFGEWRKIGQDYVVPPPKDFTVPNGPNTRIGPVDIYVATYERTRLNSTHTDDQWAHYESLADRYGGFMVFRNGLRVLPYGRVDNDFFEIEQRRSISAGREFWNARRMFGRIAITRENNPNLKDKAGREGFIDNRAAKAVKTIIINVLRTSAYQFFGQASDIRAQELEEIKSKNLKTRAEQERKNLSKLNRKKFGGLLERHLKSIPEFESEVASELGNLSIRNGEELVSAQKRLESLRETLTSFRLPGAPSPLGTLEEDYRLFRSYMERSQSRLSEMNNRIAEAITTIKPPRPEEILTQQMQRNAGQLQAALRRWKAEIEKLQSGEKERIDAIFAERSKQFHSMAMPLVERLKSGEVDLNYSSNLLETWRQQIADENSDIFEGYIAALELLRDNVDLHLIATQGINDNYDLREELNRVNQLAQLGITVEILGHELKSYDQMIRQGINFLEAHKIEPQVTQGMRTGLEGLARHLDFLSPLKVSGKKTQRFISGAEIEDYLIEFFRKTLSRDSITLEATDAFRKFKIFEQPSRILPVFINLVNNSLYWVASARTSAGRVQLGVENKRVVVSDNGPGVDSVDSAQLFRLFFTRRLGGGNGIGLYLCRMNLAAGGHQIQYADEKRYQLQSGANFVIDFKGAEYDN
ncbi:histidine kinase [Shinella sp. AETb1-6]|uniref:ATP-binding protein n=1 Tax=Shinella sp. AETb1-6 TaxID=2692210 RepID=UPI001370A7E2|nr:ATP-binding protein [Shinella sp. AETb1-6]MXN50095.1 histidine kinase [Shinella sp. AETb1-6]